MIRVRLTIHGKVQGVFFRKQAQEKAKELRVTGWVANDADGTVSLVAEGEENAVNTLIDWCRSGPSTAQVDKVDVKPAAYTHEFEEFSIRY